MQSKNRKVPFRVISALLAILIATFLVFALSSGGDSSKGPIENAMANIGEFFNNMELKLNMRSRTNKRENKLTWLKPYFKDKNLVNHPGKVLLGVYDNETKENFESIVNLEDSLHTAFPLIHIFCAWGSKPEEKFPTTQVRNIIELGSIPVITWEPWLTDFTVNDIPGLRKAELRDKNGMKDVADGVYDTYIKQWAQSAKKVKRIMFLRFGHEMNDFFRYPWGPQNNSPKDFIMAWRHVHDLFVKEGVNNVVWIWSPHPAYEFKTFYPGDAYVDYVGVGVLNYGTIAPWSKWWSFKEIFGNHYELLASFKKPILITEFGSLIVGGNRAAWYADALDSLPQKYPMVKAIIFFHFSKDNTTTQQVLNWYIKDDREVTGAIIKAINGWKQ